MAVLSKLCLDTDAYLADTGHLTTTENGAYLLLLIAMWRSADGWLAGDDRYLSHATRMTLDRWRKIAPTIRALLIERDEKVSQKRLQKEKRRNLGQLTGDGANPLKTIEPELKPLNTTYIDSFLDSDSKKSLPSKEDSERVTVGRRRKTRHPMPADWYPDEQDRAYAHRAGHGHGEVERMASACRNYHQSKGTMIADLHATWRTWVDRAAQFAYRNGQRNGGYNGRKVGIFEAWDKLSRAVEAGENSESGQGSLLGIQDRSVRRL